MVSVQRQNVILDIDDDELTKYMSLGYNQIDPVTCEVINQALPTDVGALQIAYKEHQHEIEMLHDENKRLVAEIGELKKKLAKKTAKSE